MAGPEPVLIVRSASQACALPLACVGETMRPLPVESLPGTPGGVKGVSVIRGAPTPVVDLRALLGGDTERPPARFVTLRVDDRSVALAVDAVEGIRALDRDELRKLPPLLQNADTRCVESVGVLDAQFLMVLSGAWSVPDIE
jgi:purine-binding chemotaxis protein CheW